MSDTANIVSHTAGKRRGTNWSHFRQFRDTPRGSFGAHATAALHRMGFPAVEESVAMGNTRGTTRAVNKKDFSSTDNLEPDSALNSSHSKHGSQTSVVGAYQPLTCVPVPFYGFPRPRGAAERGPGAAGGAGGTAEPAGGLGTVLVACTCGGGVECHPSAAIGHACPAFGCSELWGLCHCL